MKEGGFVDAVTTRDPVGRRSLRQFRGIELLEAVPGMIAQFSRTVPDDMWAEDVDEEFTVEEKPTLIRRRSVAVMACPCGAEPRIPLGNFVVCECDRAYLHAGHHVKVRPADPPE